MFSQRVQKILQPKTWPFIQGILLCLLAGGCLPLAFAPYNLWLFAFISPAILYYQLKSRTPKQALILGWVYGFGLWVVGAFWLYHSIHYFGDTSAPIALLMIAGMGLIMGFFNALQAWLYCKYFSATPLTFAPLWVMFEWSKTWVFTGFPWLFVGYAMTTKTLDGYAPIAGVFAVSGVTVLIAASIVEVWQKNRLWLAPCLVLIFSALYLKSIVWTTQVTNKDPLSQPNQLSVSLIQGNIPQNLKWLTTYREKTMQIYAELSHTEWGRDLIVWPEASIPMFQTEASDFIGTVNQTAKQHHSAWVTGVPYLAIGDNTNSNESDFWPFYNGIVALGDHATGLYKKQRLVPFGEYIPFEGALKWMLPALVSRADMASFSRGSSNQNPLQIKGFNLASSICYEIAYPNITRLNAQHSNFIVTLSNDAWFDHTDGPLQHLQMAQMRAIENGRWVIRATNTGVSAFINQRGEIVSRTKQYEPAVLRGQLPAMQGNTPYSRFGDTPILVICIALLLINLFKSKTSKA